MFWKPIASSKCVMPVPNGMWNAWCYLNRNLVQRPLPVSFPSCRTKLFRSKWKRKIDHKGITIPKVVYWGSDVLGSTTNDAYMISKKHGKDAKDNDIFYYYVCFSSILFIIYKIRGGSPSQKATARYKVKHKDHPNSWLK